MATHKETSAQQDGDLHQLLASRLNGPLFDKEPHVHVVPSTCQPGCAGLFLLGVTCCIELAVHIPGMVEESTNDIMYSFALFAAGLGQLVCAIAEYQRKNTFGFTTWLCYSGYWMGTGFAGTLTAAGVFAPARKGLMMSNVLWGFLSILFWLNTFATTLAVNLLFLFLGILFFLEAAQGANEHIATATGVFGIVTAALSFYIGMAVLNLEVYGKTYLPLVPMKYDFLLRKSERKLGPYGTRKDIKYDESEV